MADQFQVLPIGRLSQVPTVIGEITYLLNYVVIRVNSEKPFPMLLGRPWLYMAHVLVDWGDKEFVLGKARQRIPWKLDKYQGKTNESNKYATDWSNPNGEEEALSYFIEPFVESTEVEFKFPFLVRELAHPEEVQDGKKENPKTGPEDRSLGKINVPLSSVWIQKQLAEGHLLSVGLKTGNIGLQWSVFRKEGEEQDRERIKNIVSPSDYDKVEVESGRIISMRKSMSAAERASYVELLKEYLDVFAWGPANLRGIPPELGQHHIDLMDGFAPVRHRQYRLNLKYSLMVKEEIHNVLKVAFIYPVRNSKCISPIIVISKKVGAHGKVKIRVCQDFRKLNAVPKDYFPLPFMNIIMDHVSGHECYSFLDGFSGYNQVLIRKRDQLKTTFTIEWETFVFNRMPFGLCNAPGTFQRLMIDISKDFLRHFPKVFIDDFAIFNVRTDHHKFLRRTFQRCREIGFKLHLEKCFLTMKSGVLLAHVVNKQGLEVDSDKVKVMLALVAPKLVREVREFFGCVTYYSRFIVYYAKVAIPLTKFFKSKTDFVWTDRRQQAFEELKKVLMTAPMLSPPD